MMRKIIKSIALILLCTMLIQPLSFAKSNDSFTVQQKEFKENLLKQKSKLSLYYNDKKVAIPLVVGKHGNYDGFFQDVYVPLEPVLKKYGYKVLKQNNLKYTIIDTGRKTHDAKIITVKIVKAYDSDKKVIEFGYSKKNKIDPYMWNQYEEYMVYENTLYVQFDKLMHAFDLRHGRSLNKIHFYSDAYYKENRVQGNLMGEMVNMTVYINDEAISTPVFQSMRKKRYSTQILYPMYNYIQIEPFFEKLGAKVEQEDESKIKISSEKYGIIELDVGKTLVHNGILYNIDKNVIDAKCSAIYDGEIYIQAYAFRFLSDTDRKETEDGIYFYTKDYVRKDIPKNLEECYQFLDKELTEEDRNAIKDSTEEERADYHFGLCMWIRNEWIHPTNSPLYAYFVERGIEDPDAISSIIIEGYHAYLNGKSYDF